MLARLFGNKPVTAKDMGIVARHYPERIRIEVLEDLLIVLARDRIKMERVEDPELSATAVRANDDMAAVIRDFYGPGGGNSLTQTPQFSNAYRSHPGCSADWGAAMILKTHCLIRAVDGVATGSWLDEEYKARMDLYDATIDMLQYYVNRASSLAKSRVAA